MTANPAQPPSIVRRIAGFVVLVALGVGLYAWLLRSRAEPRKRAAQELGRPVRTLELAALEVVPRTVGYGAVEAQREWQALAEVSGVVVEMDERLEVGRIVQEGTVLLRIDPGGYQIEQTRSEATVKAARAQIAELKARESSAATNLKIELRSLELARKEYESIRKLHEAGNAPLMEVETAERAVIAAEKAVQGYRNTIGELPASRRVLEAQLEQQLAGVATTRMDLARTEIVAPFTMRLREVNVGLQQVVNAGTAVVIGDGIDVFEIPAQIPVGSLGPLLPRRPEPTQEPPAAAAPNEGTQDDGTPNEGTQDDGTPAATAASPPTDAAPAAGTPAAPGGRVPSIEAIVRLESQGVSRTWTGRFNRFGGIDPTTRTMLAVVEVDDSRRDGQRGPRLNRGLFVEVELRGQPRPDCLAVPRDAYHDGVVYVVGAEERLELRKVEATLIQEQLVCVAGEVAAGDRIVVSDLVPAIAGTLLAPRPDDEAVAALARAAKGEEVTP